MKDTAAAIAEAKRALNAHKMFWFGNQKLEDELYGLGLFDNAERFMAIDISLSEVTARDRRGPAAPNDVASHRPYKGVHLFAFRWTSKHFGRRMYLKFAVVDDRGSKRLAVFSLHETT